MVAQMTTIKSSDALPFVVVFTALLMHLLLSPPMWHHGGAREALELDNTDVAVIAYRLGREIHRKPMTCGGRNHCCLSPLDSTPRVGCKSHAPASSEKADIALITLASPRKASRDFVGPSLHSIRYGDDSCANGHFN